VWEIEIRGLLDGLSEEMSRPLERTDDMTTYVPCQKLSDFIRASDFDGIRYPSALNPEGSSIVFFDPEVAEVANSKLVEITEVSFIYSVEN
jgi:hypothetical protein